MIDAAHHGGGVPGAAVLDGLAAAMHGGALFDGVVDVRLDGCELLLEDQGADVAFVRVPRC